MEAVEGRTGHAWRTDHGEVKMGFLIISVGKKKKKKNQEEGTVRRTPQTINQLIKVFDEFCDCRWWRDADLGTWAEEIIVVFLLETKKREECIYISMPQTMAMSICTLLD